MSGIFGGNGREGDGLDIGKVEIGGFEWKGIREGRDLTDDFDDIVCVASLREEIDHTTLRSNSLKIKNVEQRFFSNTHTNIKTTMLKKYSSLKVARIFPLLSDRKKSSIPKWIFPLSSLHLTMLRLDLSQSTSKHYTLDMIPQSKFTIPLMRTSILQTTMNRFQNLLTQVEIP
jgi:hypothetical protein